MSNAGRGGTGLHRTVRCFAMAVAARDRWAVHFGQPIAIELLGFVPSYDWKRQRSQSSPAPIMEPRLTSVPASGTGSPVGP